MFTVIKASGAREAYSREKLLQSIKRAGVPSNLQEEAILHIENRLHDNIKSAEIYQHISEFLGRSEEPYSQSRYGLKEAIMMLGPTGYPFEDYLAQILEHSGYQVKTRQIMKGKCITHEIDVLARKNGKTSIIEAKFHNGTGTRTEVHVSMYMKSRFDDVKERYSLDDAMIITNTKATTDAIAFAECVGLKIFSWSYPEGGSLRDVIEELHLFPVTSLITLSQAQKLQLLENHIVLCKSICANNYLLDILHLPKEQYKKVIDEIGYICDRKIDSTLRPSPRTPVSNTL